MLDVTPEHKDHTQPEHRLIYSVVILAVRDSCLTPIKGKPPIMQWDATTAHDFLWLDALESYLHYLDIDVDYFRNKLIQTMSSDKEGMVNGFSSEDRRNFRINKSIWDRESNRLGGRVASDTSRNWHSVDTVAPKKRNSSTGNPFTYANGITPIVQYHSLDSGE